MVSFPSNVIGIFILGLTGLVLGIRGLVHYKQVKSPLTLYFGLAGLLFGISAILYSLPFALTDSEILLKIGVTLADVFYYAGIVATMKILWYLLFKKSFAFIWLLIPTLVLAMIGFVADLMLRIKSDYYVANNIATYPINSLSLKILALLSLSILVVGFLTLREARSLTDHRQKIRLSTIGALFFFGAFVVEYNFMFLQGSNNSPTSLIGYGVLIIGFFIGILFVRKQ